MFRETTTTVAVLAIVAPAMMMGSSILFVQAAAVGGDTGGGEPNLPFGDINVVVLTDVHSWVGGHGSFREPRYNADYGDVLSFYERLKEHCDRANGDLFIVNNGDWIDGTGLAVNGDPSSLVPLLEKMPYDAWNIGEHDIRTEGIVEYATRPAGFVDWWGSRYLSGNVLLRRGGTEDETTEPALGGRRYKLLRGRHANVLTFGFLYNVLNDEDDEREEISSTVIVQDVETATNSEWFKKALREEDYDAIMVLAHMDAEDPLVRLILQRIRQELGENNDDNDIRTPVQFVTGHTHARRYRKLDRASVSVEAGNYLNTIGFVSFPRKETVLANLPRLLQEQEVEEGVYGNSSDFANAPNNTTRVNSTALPNSTATTTPPSEEGKPPGSYTEQQQSMIEGAEGHAVPVNDMSSLFNHVFLDGNVDALKETLKVDTLATENGKALSLFVARTRKELGLDEVVGCIERSFYLNRTLEEEDSLWRLFTKHVMPSKFLGDEIMLAPKDSCRYDLLQGQLTVDNIIAASPYNRTLYLWQEIPSEVIADINETINTNSNRTNGGSGTRFFLPEVLPDVILASASPMFIPEGGFYDLIAESHCVNMINRRLKKLYPEALKLGSPTSLNITMTSLWIKYFTEHSSKSCGNNGDQHYRDHHGPSHHPGNATNTGGFSSAANFFQTASTEDKIQMGFAVVAVFAVVILGAVYARIAGTNYRQRVERSEHATLDALREYESEAGEFI